MSEEVFHELRWDETKVPPFNGRHFWAISLMYPVTEDQVFVTDLGAPIRVGPTAVRVSHIFCAYCECSPKEVRQQLQCEGAA